MTVLAVLRNCVAASVWQVNSWVLAALVACTGALGLVELLPLRYAYVPWVLIYIVKA